MMRSTRTTAAGEGDLACQRGVQRIDIEAEPRPVPRVGVRIVRGLDRVLEIQLCQELFAFGAEFPDGERPIGVPVFDQECRDIVFNRE